MFFIFTSSNWEMIQFDSYCSAGLKPPASHVFLLDLGSMYEVESYAWCFEEA